MAEPADSNGRSTSVTWVTKAELAKHLACTPRHINKLMRRGIVPYLKTRGFVRFDLDECDRALERFKSPGLLRAEGKPSPAPANGAQLRQFVAPPPLGGGHAQPDALPAKFSGVPTNEGKPPIVQFHAFNSIAEAREFLGSEAARCRDQGADQANRSQDQQEGRSLQVLVIIMRT